MGFKSKSNRQWLPKDTHHSVTSFIEAVDKDLSHPKEKQEIERNNLTKDELLGLEPLKKRDDIIITKADKGGAVVIISLKDYIKEAKRQLDNTEFYTKLEVNPTPTHSELINNTIRHFAKEKDITDACSQSSYYRGT